MCKEVKSRGDAEQHAFHLDNLDIGCAKPKGDRTWDVSEKPPAPSGERRGEVV